MIDISNYLITNFSLDVNHGEKLESLFLASREIIIVCPFMSVDGVRWITRNRRPDQKVEVLTEITTSALVSGSLSVNAITALLEVGCTVRYLTGGLHAKIYIFDGSKILITSANMSNSGLFDNFEMGFFVEPGVLHPSTAAYESFRARIMAQYQDIRKVSREVDMAVVESLKSSAEIWAARDQIAGIDISLPIEECFYIKRNRKIGNRDNIPTEIALSKSFSGFQMSDWNVFDHSLGPVGPENLSAFRKMLDESINRILSRFLTQLKHEPVMGDALKNTVVGFSKNMQKKKDYPFDRYMYITSDDVARKAHIGHPSIIVGMGKRHGRKYLEIRTGVEELNSEELTPKGRTFIEKLVSNSENNAAMFRELGEGWILTHGKAETEIDVRSITAERLRSEIGSYLQTSKISDLQVRKKFYLDQLDDQNLILGRNVTTFLASEIGKVIYLFRMASGISGKV